MPTLNVENLSLYYEEHGNRAGVPLVLLHNFTGTGTAVWSPFYESFGQYRMIVPDWRGHGRTDNPDGPTAMNHRQFAKDIRGLISALGLERPILCGFSSGAMMLLSLAVSDPQFARALILTACTHRLPEATRDRMRALGPESIPRERAEWLSGLHALRPDHWVVVQRAFVALADHETSEDYPSLSELEAISAPTLIVHGDRDLLFPVEIPTELYSCLPDAELCILPNTGHMVPTANPSLFSTVVLDFLKRRCTDGA